MSTVNPVDVKVIHELHRAVIVHNVSIRDITLVQEALNGFISSAAAGGLPEYGVTGVPFTLDKGICFNLLVPLHYEVRFALMGSWPKSSGYRSYPIQVSRCHPNDSYLRASNKYTGRQGKLRVELAKHCADVIDQYLEWLSAIVYDTDSEDLDRTVKYLNYLNVEIVQNNRLPDKSVNGCVFNQGFGLCNTALFVVGVDKVELFGSWEFYSGSDVHPVPDPNESGTQAATSIYWTCENMYGGDYGVLRMDLAKHIAGTLTLVIQLQELQDEQSN